MNATYGPIAREYFMAQHTSRNTFAFPRFIERDYHNQPWGYMIPELGLDHENHELGFYGFHDGSDGNNLNASCAENIIAYEVNLALGYSKEFSAKHTLDHMPNSKTIQKYRDGLFEDHKVLAAIQDMVPKVIVFLKNAFPYRKVYLAMSRQCDM